MPVRVARTTLCLGLLAALLCGSCDQIKQDPASRFNAEVKSTFLLVEEDLKTNGTVRDEYITRLRSTYDRYKGEFGQTKSFEMLDLVIRTLVNWRDSNWNFQFEAIYRANRIKLDGYLDNEFS